MWIINLLQEIWRLLRCSLKNKIILSLFLVIMIALNHYKGVKWGVIAPLTGLVAVTGVDVRAMSTSKFGGGELGKVALRLSVVLLPLLLTTSLQKQTSEKALAAITSPLSLESPPIVGRETKLMDYKNFALQSEGASVLSHPESSQVAALYFLGLKVPWLLLDFKSDPAIILQPDTATFSFPGSEGTFVIKLSSRAPVKVVSVCHTEPDQLTKPRHFSLHGSEDLEGWSELGKFTYNLGVNNLQNFTIQNPRKTKFYYMKIDIKSNWGNLDYTKISSVGVLG